MIKVISIATTTEIMIIMLQQGQVIPDSISNFLIQLPFVGILIWLWQRWEKTRREDAKITREHEDYMLKLQRNFFTEIVGAEREVQHEMVEEIRELTKQVTLNTATINEVYKVDDVVRQVLDRLEKK